MSRNTWIALMVCAGLALTYFVTRKDHVRVGVRQLVLPKVDLAEIDRIEIAGIDTVNLYREQRTWKVELSLENQLRRMPASEEYVSSLLRAAQDLKNGFFVTERKEKQNEFKVDDMGATRVSLYHGPKVVWSLSVGKEAENSGRYVRVPNEDAIFVAKGKFWDLTRNRADDWRDRKILALSSDQITQIEVAKPEKPAWKIKKVGAKWQMELNDEPLPKDFRLDEVKSAQLVRSLANARTLSFVDATAERVKAHKALESPLVRLVVHEQNGAFYELMAAKSDDQDKIWVQIEGREQVYVISSYIFTQISPEWAELRDLSLFDMSPETIRRVVLHTPKNEAVLEKKDSSWEIKEPKQIPKDFVLDNEAVSQRLARLSAMRANAWVNNPLAQAGAMSKPQVWIDLEDQSGKKQRVSFGQSVLGKSEVYVQSAVDSQLYRIGVQEKTELEKGLDLFKKGSSAQNMNFNSLPPETRKQIEEMLKKQKS